LAIVKFKPALKGKLGFDAQLRNCLALKNSEVSYHLESSDLDIHPSESDGQMKYRNGVFCLESGFYPKARSNDHQAHGLLGLKVTITCKLKGAAPATVIYQAYVRVPVLPEGLSAEDTSLYCLGLGIDVHMEGQNVLNVADLNGVPVKNLYMGGTNGVGRVSNIQTNSGLLAHEINWFVDLDMNSFELHSDRDSQTVSTPLFKTNVLGLTERDRSPRHIRLFALDKFRLGRLLESKPEADLLLGAWSGGQPDADKSKRISAKHADILVDDHGHFLLIDDSSHGTMLGGKHAPTRKNREIGQEPERIELGHRIELTFNVPGIAVLRVAAITKHALYLERTDDAANYELFVLLRPNQKPASGLKWQSNLPLFYHHDDAFWMLEDGAHKPLSPEHAAETPLSGKGWQVFASPYPDLTHLCDYLPGYALRDTVNYKRPDAPAEAKVVAA